MWLFLENIIDVVAFAAVVVCVDVVVATVVVVVVEGCSSPYLLVVVQKFNMVVTPIITRAGTALTSNQKEMKELVTNTIPGTNTVVK